MFEDNSKKESFIKNLIINLLYMALFLFLFMWIYPAPKVDLNDVKVNIDDTALKPLLNGVFADNIEAMRVSARDYYTIERLPKNIGDSSALSLNDMLNKKLLVSFVDEEGNYCDTKNSYVMVTKNELDYSMKVNLVCSKKQDYIIDTIGCYNNCKTNNTSKSNSTNNNVIYTSTKKNTITANSQPINNTKYIEYVKVIEEDNRDNSLIVNDYSATPLWSNNSNYSCNVDSDSCIKTPLANDPYSGNSLSVILISNSINNKTPGTYTLTYKATTEHGIIGTTNVTVTIIKKETKVYRKYISNYNKSYYNDGYYSGYLDVDYNSNAVNRSKYISNYAWTNRVRYTYKCVYSGSSGTDGWAYVSTDTSDNHPTFYYSYNNYSGTLSKSSFYCKTGCSEKLIPELGTCYNVGQTKSIYKTYVGLYSGYVYSTTPIKYTYSGYVYLID